MNRPFIILFIIVIAAGCKSVKPTASKQDYKRDSTNIKEPVAQDTIKPHPPVFVPKATRKKDTISIIGVGDIMLGTNFPDPKYLPPNDGGERLKPVHHILQDADLTFGNHEGVILNKGGTPKKCSDSTLCYLFRSPEKYVKNLVEAGFDVMSVANNHMGDFGEEGRKNTIRVLTQAGIHNGGLLIKPYTTFIIDSVKYGLAAFAPNTGTVDLLDIDGARKIVSHLDSVCDIVIVSFHGGAEGKKFQHVTRKMEMYVGEERGNVYDFAHKMIDAGGDIVFGHGPHVTRAMDMYKERFIIYSMGNFCTYARFNLKDENGIAPIIKLYVDQKGKFLKGKIFPIVQLGEGGPLPDEQRRAIYKLKELTAADFPEVKIAIEDSGEFYLRR